MNTGFKNLDKIVNLGKAEIILITGTNADILSGDIANSICLKQEYEVLEVASHKKEYLIKRLLVNQSNVDYRKWTLKDNYTDKELQQIGQATINLIEVTKRLPTIIEQNMNLYDFKNITKLVSDFANRYADRETVSALVVLDIFPLNAQYIDRVKYRKDVIRIFKDMNKISKKLNIPIIIVYDIDIKKKYNSETYQAQYIMKQDIKFIDNINKYIDKYIILNQVRNTENEYAHIFNVDIYNQKEKIDNCKLVYDYKMRKFDDYLNSKR